MTITIVDLPVEIQSHIIRMLFFSLHRASMEPDRIQLPFRASSSEECTPDEELPYRVWEESSTSLRSPTLFPFNVALTCDLWREIVAGVADYWPRLVFDVSKPRETRALLIAFDVVKDKLVKGQIEVLVYSSRELEKAEENREVKVIMDALQPYVPKCKSVTFHLTYASSLPPSYAFFLQDASHLHTLEMCCRVDDMEAIDIARQMVERIALHDTHLEKSFSGLSDLVLSGPGFMDLMQCIPDPEWLTDLNLSLVIISHFEFTRDGPYSLVSFVEYLSKLNISCLHLRHLSLAYEYEGDSYLLPAGYCPPYIPTGLLCFKSVSEAFIKNLYAISDITADHSLCFEDCSIPANVRCEGGDSLHLDRIHDAAEGLSDSLCHILKVWGGRRVTFNRCPAVNDELLAWMGKQVDYVLPDDIFYPENGTSVIELDRPLPAGERFSFSQSSRKGLPMWNTSSLHIRDCENFSPAALRGMLQARKDIVLRSIQRREEGQADQVAIDTSLAPVDDDQIMVSDLVVYSKIPLSKKDKTWFEANVDTFEVNWFTRIGDDSWTVTADIFTARQADL
ncbi:hypothetical protein CVT26_012547 [Gymnopilus dilepis]|uniref:F-box domain-containing protein n=1 Tax=Gymnopilus dilepis TaxID=231916 RepID=A0A409WAI6_9AGAR|nr:hypothetical protein CVT26_012547 [Gymnopilus dilepis]